MSDTPVFKNGIKLLGELVVPGASLLMEEKISLGVAHMGLAIVARAAFGPVGVAVVAANSLSTSITGQGLLANIQSTIEGKVEEAQQGAAEDAEDANYEAEAEAEAEAV